MSKTLKSRGKAFTIHLLISSIILAVILSIFYYSWFPGRLIEFGGLEGAQIAIAIDLILGPALTLVIFNPKKTNRLLRIDLAAIGCVQAIALSLGIWVIYQERPFIQVLSYTGMYIHTVAELKRHDIDQSQFDDYKGDLPKLVYLDLPSTRRDFLSLQVQASQKGELLSLTKALYRQPKEVDIALIRTQLENTLLDQDSACYWLDVNSAYGTLKGCFKPGTGLIHLKAQEVD